MAINLATLQRAAMNAVPALQKRTLFMASAISTDFSDEIRSPLESVEANVIGSPTPAAFLGAKYSDDLSGDVSAVKIQLNEKPVHKTFKLTRAQSLSARDGGDVLDKLLAANAGACVEKMLTDVLSLGTKAALGAPIMVVKEDAITYKGMTQLRTKLTEAGFQTSGRKVVFNSAAHDNLLADDKVTNLRNDVLATAAVTQAVLPRIAGMDVLEAPEFPAVDNAIGFAMLPQAVAVVSRAFEPVAGNDTWTVMTEPTSGLSLVVKSWSNADTEEEYVSVSLLYGVKLLQPGAMKRICSVADS